MKLPTTSSNNSSNSNFDKKSDTSSSSSKYQSNASKLENLDEDSKKKQRLNQNRISAMKCRQKKKQQFHNLMKNKQDLELCNMQLKEKLENIKKQFKETEEENADLKKRLDYMEKQQEILFRIVSESRASMNQNHYMLSSVATLSTNNLDPQLSLSVEQRFGSSNMSAFTPSRPAAGIQRPIVQMATNHSQTMNASNQQLNCIKFDSTPSLTQLLSEIYRCNVNKQL